MTAHSRYDQTRTSFWSALYSFKRVLPGLLAMLFIALFSNNLAGVPNPFTLENLFYWLDGVIGPVNHQPVFGILNSNFVWNPLLLGLIIGNIFGVPDSWKPGLSYIHKLMPLGIILLGPHFVIGHAFKVGGLPILLAVIFMILTATLTLYIARLFKLDDRYSSVLAGSLATGDPHVCPILMPMIKAKGGQVVNAAASVILFGALLSFLFPLIGGWFGLSEKFLGLAAALGVGNGAQALNAGFGTGYEAGRYALYFDVVRHVIMPAGFLYVFLVMFVRKLRYRNDPTVMATRGVKKIPPYVIVFVLGWSLACLYFFKEPARHAIFSMVQWDFSLAAASLGLSLTFREIGSVGMKGFLVACIAGTVRILALLAVILICAKAGLLA